jgi:hypothetical protein
VSKRRLGGRRRPSELLAAPLRAIVDYLEVTIADGVTAQRELLECGHVVPIKRDMIGETNASRRRCKACLLEQRQRT